MHLKQDNFLVVSMITKTVLYSTLHSITKTVLYSTFHSIYLLQQPCVSIHLFWFLKIHYTQVFTIPVHRLQFTFWWVRLIVRPVHGRGGGPWPSLRTTTPLLTAHRGQNISSVSIPYINTIIHINFNSIWFI